LLTLEAKQSIVSEVAEVIGRAQSVIAAENQGLTVSEMTELRVKAREAGVYLRVVKNTLTRRAVEGSDYACIQEALQGPLLLALSTEDPASAARVLNDFSKDHAKLVVKIVAVNGQLLSAADVSSVANLPTRDEAISQLMAVMKAPVEKFVRTLAEPANKLVRTIAAVRDQKDAA